MGFCGNVKVKGLTVFGKFASASMFGVGSLVFLGWNKLNLAYTFKLVKVELNESILVGYPLFDGDISNIKRECKNGQ